ncbi:hypothetical protein ASG17_07680 [Brevundimonas sp. Leaf363]|uniref:hypothetical protein n=1 Tax=Brevundimonas sp. Leaf363 TaxID=1736353 RepID=UPI0006FBB5C6|nr:hypothetical protein [Brevundimonas sp. Leaf363]KQS55922.1 hypothetical protein ASG17_07680 [Brevundimonas sp. Leaf363]
MNRRDLLDLELNYARMVRREAKSRAKRYPAVAEQLNRWADAAQARAEAIRCGPLFDSEAA